MVPAQALLTDQLQIGLIHRSVGRKMAMNTPTILTMAVNNIPSRPEQSVAHTLAKTATFKYFLFHIHLVNSLA
jgi:hypothetical protein